MSFKQQLLDMYGNTGNSQSSNTTYNNNSDNNDTNLKRKGRDDDYDDDDDDDNRNRYVSVQQRNEPQDMDRPLKKHQSTLNGYSDNNQNSNQQNNSNQNNDNCSFDFDLGDNDGQSNTTSYNNNQSSSNNNNNNNNNNNQNKNQKQHKLATMDDLMEQRRQLLEDDDDDDRPKKLYKWQWRDDRDQYKDYAKDINEKIEKHYAKTREIFKVDDERYLDFKVMAQRRFDNPDRVRKIKRVEIVQNSTTTTSNQNDNNNNNQISSYSSSSVKNSNQNNSIQNNQFKQHNNYQSNNNQTNQNNNNNNNQNTPTGPVWSYLSDNGWEKYSKEVNEQLEKAYNAKKKNVPIDDDRFVDLDKSVQRRFDDTNKIRPVKRELLNQNNTNQNNNNQGKGYNNNNNNNNNYNNQNNQKINNNNNNNNNNNSNYNHNNNSNNQSNNNSSSGKTDFGSFYKKPTVSSPTTTSSSSSDVKGKGLGKWYWQSDRDFVQYDGDINEKIEAGFISGEKKIIISIGNEKKIIDFETFHQRRFDDPDKRRSIKRVVEASFNTTNQPQQPLKQSNSTQSKHQKTIVNSPTYIEFDDQDTGDLDESSFGNQPYDNNDDIDLDDPDFTEKKRKLYVCGDDYLTIDNIQSWYDFIEEKREKFKTNSSPLFPPDPILNQKISLMGRDITTLEIDGILNAAKSSLLGGGGIDGAIHKAAGYGLFNECRKIGGCRVGDSKITKGHKLPAKYVIHTVGPIDSNADHLKSCYSSTLQLIEKHNIRTFAFCCVATGIFGFPALKAAHIALTEVRTWLQTNHHLVDRLIFCVFTHDDYLNYGRLLQSYFPIHPK